MALQKLDKKEDYIVMQKAIEDSTLTAIVPNHSSVKLGILMSIIRQ